MKKYLNWMLKNNCTVHKHVFILLLVFSAATGFAQDKDKQTLISIKQRILQRKHEDIKEQVDSFHTLHLMIAGNIYQTEKHINCAYNPATGKYDFNSELKYIQPILNLGDITIANLKTSFGDNASNMFSCPDEFCLSLKYAGINALMHANMHTANIDKATLKRTRNVLNEFDMNHTGAFENNIERMGNYPLIMNKKGFRVALLNYTYLPSRPAVSRDFYINEVDKSLIERDMRMAFANKPDLILVYFDWGENAQPIPSHAQQELAQFAFNKGANLVVGTCPNSPMRIDYMNYYYQGKGREGIVAYSLGNLIASNEEIKNRNGYILDMEVKKNNFTGDTRIDDWGVIPVYTYYDTTTTPGKTTVYSLPCWAVESGDIFPKIPYIEKRRVVNGAYEVRKMLGSVADEIQYNMNEQVVNNVGEAITITAASLNNKFSQKHASDIKPSAAPQLPTVSDGSNVSPSLAKISEEISSATPPPAPTKAEKKKEASAYLQARNKAEEAFNMPGSASQETVPATSTAVNNSNTAATTQATQAKEPSATPIKEKAEPITAGTDKTEKLAPTTAATTEVPLTVKEKELVAETDTIYRIQFYALKKYLPMDTNYYTHLKGYDVYEENGMFKYVLGRYKNYQDCYNFWHNQIQPRYKESFIVKFVNGRRVLK